MIVVRTQVHCSDLPSTLDGQQSRINHPQPTKQQRVLLLFLGCWHWTAGHLGYLACHCSEPVGQNLTAWSWWFTDIYLFTILFSDWWFSESKLKTVHELHGWYQACPKPSLGNCVLIGCTTRQKVITNSRAGTGHRKPTYISNANFFLPDGAAVYPQTLIITHWGIYRGYPTTVKITG